MGAAPAKIVASALKILISNSWGEMIALDQWELLPIQGRFEFSEGPTLKASYLTWIVLYKDNHVIIYHIWLL